MRGLDTNVLVRYAAHDDDAQHEAAAALLEGATDRGEPLFVSDVVLCELAWVLRSVYRQSRATLVRVLAWLLGGGDVRPRPARGAGLRRARLTRPPDAPA